MARWMAVCHQQLLSSVWEPIIRSCMECVADVIASRTGIMKLQAADGMMCND